MYRDETKNLVEFPYKRVTLDLTLDRYELNSDQTLRTDYYTISGYDNTVIKTAYDTGLPVYVECTVRKGSYPNYKFIIEESGNDIYWYAHSEEVFNSIGCFSGYPSQIRVNGIVNTNGFLSFKIHCWLPV